MTTIINTPPVQAPASSDGGSGMVGIFVGIILMVVIGFFFFAYGLPAMRGSENERGNDSLNPTINIPDKVDVNIKQ